MWFFVIAASCAFACIIPRLSRKPESVLQDRCFLPRGVQGCALKGWWAQSGLRSTSAGEGVLRGLAGLGDLTFKLTPSAECFVVFSRPLALARAHARQKRSLGFLEG